MKFFESLKYKHTKILLNVSLIFFWKWTCCCWCYAWNIIAVIFPSSLHHLTQWDKIRKIVKINRTMYDFHDSTDTLKFWTEKCAINKTFVFHLILMKLGEVVIIHVYYNFTKFHQNRMKNKKKVLLIAHFSVQNFKVSVELWKLYIVHTVGGLRVYRKIG